MKDLILPGESFLVEGRWVAPGRVRWRLPAADKAVLDEAVKKREADFAAAQAEFQKAMSIAIVSLRRSGFNEAEFRAAVADARD